MKRQTKLVNCGSRIFVYDFNGSSRIRNLRFERDLINCSIIDLKRLLITNFEDDRLLAAFSLKFDLRDYENTQGRLERFINEIKITSGQSNIKYLAVLELPLKENNSEAFIHLITDVESVYLTGTLQKDLIEEQEFEYLGEQKLEHQEEQELDYLEELWEDQIIIDGFSSAGGLIESFTSAYYHSLTSDLNKRYQDVLFQSKLKRPVVLWNDKAEEFIRNNNLVDYLIHTEEFYDSVGGFVISNEYSA